MRVSRLAGFAALCALGMPAGPGFCAQATNAVFRSESLERLMAAAAQEKGLHSTFTLAPAGGAFVVDVYGRSPLGPFVYLCNGSDCVVKLSSFPPHVESLGFECGSYDLRDLKPSLGVRWLRARCEDLSVDTPALCALFPYAETLSLDVNAQQDAGSCLKALTRLRKLKRLELTCLSAKEPLAEGLIKTLLAEMPQLEKFSLDLNVALPRGPASGDSPARGESRRHTFEISDRLKDGSDVVEVPDCRAYTDVTLRLWSPTVRFVEFRPAPGNGKPAGEKPQSLTLYLHNVVPSGERRLIDGGELCYRIRIDEAEEDACDAQP